MRKCGILVVLMIVFFLRIDTLGAADENNGLNQGQSSRSQILREHHRLLHRMLMVMKDQAEITEKVLSGKHSPAEKRTMRKRLTEMSGEIDGMIQKHDGMMKAFEEMIEKRGAEGSLPPEEPPPQ